MCAHRRKGTGGVFLQEKAISFYYTTVLGSSRGRGGVGWGVGPQTMINGFLPYTCLSTLM